MDKLIGGKVWEELKQPLVHGSQFNPLDDTHPLSGKLAAGLRTWALVGGAMTGLSWAEGGSAAAIHTFSYHAKLLAGAYVAAEYVVAKEAQVQAMNTIIKKGQAQSSSVPGTGPPTVASFVAALTTQSELPGSESRLGITLPDPVEASTSRVFDYTPAELQDNDGGILPPSDRQAVQDVQMQAVVQWKEAENKERAQPINPAVSKTTT